MKKHLFVTMFVCAVVAMFLSESAWAKVQATASWKINNNSIEFRGLGGNNAEALENARANCRQAQTIESWKNFCLNAPERLQYSTIPEGTYTRSCGTCGVRKEGEAEFLVCSFCRPVMEQRRLNLSQCPTETRDKIENCHGELICGVCP